MSDDRLDTGMRTDEAVRLASAWWNDVGRHELRQVANSEQDANRFRPSTEKSPAILIKGETRAVVPSGILNGLRWDDLDRREQMRVVQVWHHYKIRLPQANGDKQIIGVA